MARKAVSDEVQNTVLLKSRRRCCLCFWLDGIDEVVKGQIAHLDQNHQNADVDNLVFLCHNHHDEYDSRTSTSKGLREGEVRRWRDELYREMEYRFRTVLAGPLTFCFDETRHCFKEDNDSCTVYRIAVRNEGVTTVANVTVKIVDIEVTDQVNIDDLRRLHGLKLAVSVNPFGAYCLPDNPPKSSVVLHPSEEAIFDFVRLCKYPGNYRLLHSHFVFRTHTSRWEQFPRGVIPSGNYGFTISVQGTNLGPTRERYKVSSTDSDVVLCRVDTVW